MKRRDLLLGIPAVLAAPQATPAFDVAAHLRLPRGYVYIASEPEFVGKFPIASVTWDTNYLELPRRP